MTENPRNAMVWATPYLKNEFGNPRFFFTFFIESYHFLPSVKVLKKSVCGKFNLSDKDFRYWRYLEDWDKTLSFLPKQLKFWCQFSPGIDLQPFPQGFLFPFQPQNIIIYPWWSGIASKPHPWHMLIDCRRYKILKISYTWFNVITRYKRIL